MSHPQRPGVTRRHVLAGASALLANAALPAQARALAPARAERVVGAQMVARAQALLRLLDGDQRTAVGFAFDSPRRQAWNFMIGSGVAPGLPLERMTADQTAAAMDLLATGLGSEGLDKARRVMLLQDVLRERGEGGADRNSARFSVAFHGTPCLDAPWSWRFEGHHLTLTFTLMGDELISLTPSSFSANPNHVTGGPHRGLVALQQEEVLGRTLISDLRGAASAHALIDRRAPGNVQALAGQLNRVAAVRLGVALADLPQAQVDLFLRIADLYAADHLVPALADQQRARLREGDLMAARFGWAGTDRPGDMLYYRLHGDNFLIEFAGLRNEPLHLHTIRHDLTRNLGRHRM